METFNLTLLLTAVLLLSTGCQSLSEASSPKPDPTKPTVTAAPDHTQSSVIELVKTAILPEYNSTTVGKAFSGTFQNPKWSTFDTEKGQTIVEFTGTITWKATKQFHRGIPTNEGIQVEGLQIIPKTCGPVRFDDEYMVCVDAIVIPVKFQFILSADKTNFTVSAIDLTAFGTRATTSSILTWIYQ